MKKTKHLIVVTALLITFGVIGGAIEIIDTAEASSTGGLSHPGLAGTTFLVRVKDLDAGTTNLNCYTFVKDGVWIDPRFLGPKEADGLVPGNWIQHTGGLTTRYTAFARTPFELDLNPFGIPVIGQIRLIQNGTVFRNYKGKRMFLRAYSTAIANGADGDVVIGNFLSRGFPMDLDECYAKAFPPPVT